MTIPTPPPETGEEQNGNPDDNPPVLSDEEALTGQWLVFYLLDDETQEMEFGNFVIDIQYTAPGYWIMAYMKNSSDSIAHSGGFKVQSNRTLQEDGWFVVSVSEAEDLLFEIRYRFRDSDRNTLDAEYHEAGAQDVDKMELRRIVGRVIEISEEEPK